MVDADAIVAQAVLWWPQLVPFVGLLAGIGIAMLVASFIIGAVGKTSAGGEVGEDD